EEVILSDRHAAIRIAIRPEHKGVRKQTGPAKDFLLVLGNQPQCAYPMKELFSQCKIVDIWWSNSALFLIGVARVIEQAARPECASSRVPSGKYTVRAEIP